VLVEEMALLKVKAAEEIRFTKFEYLGGEHDIYQERT
jgi:hypothetical protein